MKDQFDLDDLFEEPKSEAKPAPVEPAKPMALDSRLIQHANGVVTVDGFVHQAPAGSGYKIGQRYEATAMLGDDRAFRDDLRSPVYVQRSSKTGLGCFVPTMLILIALAVGFGLGALVGAWRSAGGDTVEPDVDPVAGAYVAIFYNDTDLDSYTKSQRDFINSVNTANWLEEHKVNWKKIDTDPMDVSKLEKPFQVMAEKHRSKEPWIVIASGKKFASEPIENDVQAMKLLEKWVK